MIIWLRSAIWCLLSVSLLSSTVPQHTSQSDRKMTWTWMHTQKTSSWPGDLLLLWGCPHLHLDYANFLSRRQMHAKYYYDRVKKDWKKNTADCNIKFLTPGNEFGKHYGYNRGTLSKANSSLFMMIRDPTDRVVSAFLYG